MSKNDSIDKVTLPFILSCLGVSESELHAQGIEAQELLKIYNDYVSRVDELEEIGLTVVRMINKAEHVHALRYRVKEPLHLLKKIIRKKKEYPDRCLNDSNYLEYINDLVGVRIMYLYKESWQDIGNYIQGVWELKRAPYVYAENPAQASYYTSGHYKVLINPRGYKAMHYIIKTKPNKQLYFVEIQVKTLFEEGWSEIDHSVRYPDHEPNELLIFLLQLLNKLTTQADVLATHIQYLAEKLKEYKQQGYTSKSVTELRNYVAKLPIQEEEKQQLYIYISNITDKDNPVS